jgi:hypothetical protein
VRGKGRLKHMVHGRINEGCAIACCAIAWTELVNVTVLLQNINDCERSEQL